MYDPIAQFICSTSDDRTIRLWKINNSKSKNWKNIDIKLVRTMFGHTARIWKSIIKNNIIITIGEVNIIIQI